MTKKYEVDVVGCGSIAKEYGVPALEANPHVPLSAAYDYHWPNAEQSAEHHDILNEYDGYESFLALDLDLATISTPSSIHVEHTIEPLESDAYVLCGI